MSAPQGRLVLVGTPIGNLGDLAPRAIAALAEADVIAAEDTRRTRALLTHSGLRAGRRLVALHAHNEVAAGARLVDRMRAGEVVVYVTDAGMPGISDPGERLVRACVEAEVAVEVVPGPSALLTALVVSGLPAGRFVFEGFLPRGGRARRERLEQLVHEDRTLVLYESPRRLAATLHELAAVLGSDRLAVVARELTKVHEEVRRGSLGELAAEVTRAPPRGEHVVVIGPGVGTGREGVEDGPRGDEVIDAALAPLLAAGLSARDATVAVAGTLGVPKKRVYARTHGPRQPS